MKLYIRKMMSVVMILVLLIPGSVSATEITADINLMINETAESIKLSYQFKGYNLLDEKEIFRAADSGSDWIAMTLAFAGIEEDYDEYLKRLEAYVVEKYNEQGYLENIRATEYHRIALAMYSLGGNPENILTGAASINLIYDGVFDFHGGSPGLQGTNGLIYALMAADAKQYTELENSINTRQTLINELLLNQGENGAFSLDPNLGGDYDITAMALQALAPYKEQPEVNEAIEKALFWMETQLTEDGMLISYGSESCESVAQTILALCALGIDPAEDEKFIRHGKTLLDSLHSFRDEKGMYLHSYSDEEYSMLSTYQSLLALEAVEKYRTEGTWIFDFSDYTAPKSTSEKKGYLIVTAGSFMCVTLGAVIFMKKKKRTM